jgi:hypothetical protein
MLSETLRTEIRQILDEGEFTIATASRLERVAHAAKEALAAFGGVPEAIAKVKDDQTVDGEPVTFTDNPAETFGARMLKEIVASIAAITAAPKKESAEGLVQALITARENGMTDVAAELEKKLCGKPLDGERPVLGRVQARIGKYLDGEMPGEMPAAEVEVPDPGCACGRARDEHFACSNCGETLGDGHICDS